VPNIKRLSNKGMQMRRLDHFPFSGIMIPEHRQIDKVKNGLKPTTERAFLPALSIPIPSSNKKTRLRC
jgi:hypothetical protein